MMKILLVGGAGHIGGRLASALASGGIEVGVTRRSKSNISSQNKITNILTEDVLSTRWGDVCAGYSHIINLVSPREQDCNKDPVGVRRVVEDGSRMLGEVARDMGARFIYLSTSQVYGPVLSGVVSEDSTTKPGNTYAEVHLAAECVVKQLVGERATIVRLANSVGLPTSQNVDTWQLLVQDIAREAVTRGTLTLRSAGLQHRSFVAMSEVVDALIHVITSDDLHGVVNISNPTSMSVRSMAERIRHIYGNISGKIAELRAPQINETDQEITFQLESRVLAARGVPLGSIEALDLEIFNIIGHVMAY